MRALCRNSLPQLAGTDLLTEEADAVWRNRIGGIRANASRMSHAKLDTSEVVDDGNPAELGRHHAVLKRLLPTFHVLGGCCGTDHRHADAIADCGTARSAA